ncbi:MAG: crossover junction endodeoxyribonuclease RuvC [Oscillospiraceae bacterium]|nr:crossover junction endodeoxyribonuclease RuvC [Oscillospiraceae bacterium]
MVILGIDPGYATVGFGLVEGDRVRQRLIQCGTIKTPAGGPLAPRLKQIYDDTCLLIRQFTPDAMAVEALFFNTNAKTAIPVAHGRGVLLLAGEAMGVPVFEYTPLQVKQAVTGYGRAEKAQVMEMVRRLLGLEQIPKPDDAADALAVALCHLRSTTSLMNRAGG